MTQATDTLADLVRAAVQRHRRDRGPLLEILHDIQASLGFIDPAAVPLLASELNLSRADVHGVVTFYEDFRDTPPGQVQVNLCRAEACQAMGAEELVAAVEKRLDLKLGSTAADGGTTLEQVFCLGNCALGPSGRIAGRIYGRLNVDRVAALIEAEDR